MDQTDDKNQAKEVNVASVPLGGAEGMPQPVETGVASEVSKTTETADVPESPKFGEKAKEQATEKQSVSSTVLAQTNPQKPEPVKPQAKKEFPMVYGYKIPAQMQENIGLIKRGMGKGDPKKSVTWLKVFVDRLLKMSSN